MKLVFLHLTDIHISEPSDPILAMGDPIGEAAFGALIDADCLLLVVSGDIANAGQESQYLLAKKFLLKIRDRIRSEYPELSIQFVIVPGNHDCNLSGDQKDRNDIIEKILSGREWQEQQKTDGPLFDICIKVQSEFEKFREDLCGYMPGTDRLWMSIPLDFNGVKVIIDAINLSWTSQNPEIVGKLLFPIKNYEDKLSEPCDVRIAVFHHPHHWLSQSIFRDFRSFIRRLANVVITGHEHHGNSGTIEESESGLSAFIEGEVLQHGITEPDRLAGTGFSVVTLSGDCGEIFVHQGFAYDESSKRYVPSGNPTSRTLTPIERDQFQISQTFLNTIEEIMVPINQTEGRGFHLSDIFEFPSLRGSEEREIDRVELYKSEALANANNCRRPVLLLGAENAGKTSLLYQLFKRFWEAGYVPVYVSGAKLKRSDPAELKKVVEAAVAEQYGQSAVVKFQQTSKDLKRLLLDNVDDSPVKSSKARAKVLKETLKGFGGAIITAPPEFAVKELLADGEDEEVFRQFDIQPFGYTLRAKLVQKWVSSHTDETLADDVVLKKRDEAERLLSDVMGKNMVPSLPLYLVTLLQSLDVGKQEDLRGAGLGHYYEYLLTESFLAAGAKREKFVELYSYLSALAWHMSESDTDGFSLRQFRDFNDQYSKDWVPTIAEERLEFLLRAKTLKIENDDILFKYDYIYYLMKAKYMSDHLHSAEVRAHIGECCGALNISGNAHTVLFLSHYSVDPLILDSIVDANRKVFVGETSIKLSEDLAPIKQLILDSPKIVLPRSSVEENRHQANERMDMMNSNGGMRAEDVNEDDAVESDISISLLFKTSEILGHLLRDQYSRIDRQRKRELIKEIFEAPMRGVAYMYRYLAELPPVLRLALEDVNGIKKSGGEELDARKERLARRVVSLLIQAMTLVFIKRAADSARSDDVADDVAAVVSESDNNAYYLVDVAIDLDMQRSLPRKKLINLKKRFEGNVIASRLLQWLVVYRLMMFLTSEGDLGWAAQQFDLNEPVVRTLSNKEPTLAMGSGDS